MVRTADTALRVTGGKASRKGSNVTVRQESSRSRSPSGGSGDKGGSTGLNPICPRETPSWQRPITNFFTCVDKEQTNKPQNKPGHSKNAADDIDMMDDNQANRGIKTNKNANVEAMDEEEEFQDIKINKSETSRPCIENEESNGVNAHSSNDIEMNECNGNSKKKVNYRDEDDDCDEDMVPKKRMKLDKNMFMHFKNLEKS